MIVAKIEIWPYGDRQDARNIGAIGIANISPTRRSVRMDELFDPLEVAADPRRGLVFDYLADIIDDTGFTTTGLISGHAREDTFWPLIAHAANLRHHPADPPTRPALIVQSRRLHHELTGLLRE